MDRDHQVTANRDVHYVDGRHVVITENLHNSYATILETPNDLTPLRKIEDYFRVYPPPNWESWWGVESDDSEPEEVPEEDQEEEQEEEQGGLSSEIYGERDSGNNEFDGIVHDTLYHEGISLLKRRLHASLTRQQKEELNSIRHIEYMNMHNEIVCEITDTNICVKCKLYTDGAREEDGTTSLFWTPGFRPENR
jgi:hypothetical protein